MHELAKKIEGSEKGVGLDLRESDPNFYYQIRNQRNEARDSERNAIANNTVHFLEPKPWKGVEADCLKSLKNSTKDLELAAWLIEAKLRTEGFAGIAEAFTIAADILENYWEDCFPVADDDEEVEDRLLPLINLSGQGGQGTLVIPIRSLPITGKGPEGVSACTWQLVRAGEVDRILEKAKKESQLKSLSLTSNEIKQLASKTPLSEMQKIYQDAKSALDSYSKLSNTIDQKLGFPASSSGVKEALETVLSSIRYLCPAAVKAGETEVPDNLTSENDTEDQNMVTKQENGVIDSRASAVKALERVSEYFRNAEPHSPISYSIDQMLRWIELPLPELMKEIVGDEKALATFFKYTGIQGSGKKK